MSVARAIQILIDVRARLEEAALAEDSPQPLDKQFADDAEAREAAPERWAMDKLDKAIQMLKPHVGY